VTEYPELDEEIKSGLQSHSPACLDATQDLFHKAHHWIEIGNQTAIDWLKQLFHFHPDQDNVSFLFILAQVISSLFTVQDSISVAHFCTVISTNRTFESLSLLINEILNRTGESPQSLDPLLNFSDVNHKSEWWLACSELGWFPTASSDSLRSPWINLSYFDKICFRQFGIRAVRLSDRENRFGGLNPSVSSVYFTVGGADPYRFLNAPPGINRSSLEIYRSVIPPPAGISADLFLSTSSNASSPRTECLEIVRG
jgi:hypothetical protein